MGRAYERREDNRFFTREFCWSVTPLGRGTEGKAALGRRGLPEEVVSSLGKDQPHDSFAMMQTKSVSMPVEGRA